MKHSNQTFTHKSVIQYLGQNYLLSHRKGSRDFYYNHRNRLYFSIPVYKNHWVRDEVIELFSSLAITHKSEIEFNLFINQIKTNKNEK